MPNPITISWLKNKNELYQEYDLGLEYCFVNTANEQVVQFVTCKDFLQDAICAIRNKKKIEIYQFEYDPQADRQIDLEKTRIAITNGHDKGFLDRVPAIVDLLNQVEKKLHLVRTIAVPVENPPKGYKKSGVVVLEGSSRWMLSPPMLSWYTLLIRVGAVHKVGDKYAKTFKNLIKGKVEPYQEADAEQLQSARSGIERIMKYGYAKIFYKDPDRNYPNVDVELMHNYFGIVAYSNEETKSRVKYWHRNVDKKPKKKEVKA